MALWENGLLPEKLEFLDGEISAAPGSSYAFGMREARAAAKLGIRVHSAVDAVVADEQARGEALTAGRPTRGRRWAVEPFGTASLRSPRARRTV